MELLDNKKRAYLGYFLSIIRVDLYNKILLRSILNTNFSHSYNSLDLENNLKAELQKGNTKHYFYVYFEKRLTFYNKFYKEVEYSVEEIIDLIYEYRNFLLDDKSRIIPEKFPLTVNKTVLEKEEEINIIILLLLSENLLEEYGKYSGSTGIFKNYQKHFYCQKKDVIAYRKYVNKYFGISNYTNKINFLERQIIGFDISYPKKYSLVLHLFSNLKLSDENRLLITNLDIALTKDFLKENYGLLQIDYKEKKILININQLLILYLLSKLKKRDILKPFLERISKTYKEEKINVLTRDIYLFNTNIIHELFNVSKNKEIAKNYFNFKTNELKKDLTSTLIIKMFLNYNLKKNNINIKKINFNNNNLENSLINLEIIDYKLINFNLKESTDKYLKEEFSNSSKMRERIYAILNQIKFTMNILDFNKLDSIDEDIIYSIQKDYKTNKKEIIKSYIITMYLLLELRVHKYKNNSKFKNAYIYRNKIMHFQKDIFHKEIEKFNLILEINRLRSIHKTNIKEITFSQKFFYLLEYKTDD